MDLAILLLKIGLIAGVIAQAAWVIVYTRLQPWWRDVIGLTLVINVLISLSQLGLLGLAMFVHLTRGGSSVIAWLYALFTLAISPLMLWRIAVWIRVSKVNGLPGSQNGDS